MPDNDQSWMRKALRLARKGLGRTSPNPMVGAILVRHGKVLGRGWHHRAGAPHAEIEAIRDAQQQGHRLRGAELFVTLEPCCTHGRTPPCTDAIIREGITRVVIGATDPNPKHAGKGFAILRAAGIRVDAGILANECNRLNEAFNHWIVHRTPWITVKAAMTLDGKIATATGESKWITSDVSRRYAMRLRQEHDAILVGVNTILADNPSLTVRLPRSRNTSNPDMPKLRRIVLDSRARTPLEAKVVSDDFAALTTIVVGPEAPARRVAALSRRVAVLQSPAPISPSAPGIHLPWLLKHLGSGSVTSLLVEGGGEVNAAFLQPGLAHCVAFFYAPKILGGRNARKAVAGAGFGARDEVPRLKDLVWRSLGPDLLLTARVGQ